MDHTHLRQLRDAVATDPGSAYARTDLVRGLLDSGQLAEAFEHLGVAYRLGLADSLAASRVHRLLVDVAAGFVASAGLTVGAAPAPRSTEPSPPLEPPPLVDGAEQRSRVRVESDAGDGDPGDGGAVAEFARPTVTLDDVAGLDAVKRYLAVRLFAPLRNPDLAARYGKTPSGGLLMWGPPGCGKTFIARAVAGSLDIDFCSVGMDEVLDMWIGTSERNLASVFAAARRHAPAALFFDEADAIGGRRSRMGVHVTMRSVVSVLLTELDGAVRDNSGVFTIAATNLPWDIDPALRRPGRFDRTLFVPPPDHAARIAILANRLTTVPLGHDLQLARIASMTAGFSGADVGGVADAAIDDAFGQALASGSDVVVDQAILERAARAGSSSIGDWIQSATTAAEASNDTELYAPFLDWLDHRGRDR